MSSRNSRHRWLAGFAAVLLSSMQNAGAAPSMDLSSTTAGNPVSSSTLNNAPAAVINVAGHQRIVHAGDSLTNAQIVALKQVMTTGQQSLQIGGNGAATGGSVNLGLFGSNFATMNVPVNVQAFGSAAQTLSIAGGLIASGSLTALTNGTKFSIDAGNVLVNPGGEITSINTAGKAIDLLISSSTNIVNLGSISSSKNLVLTAGDGNITNAGTIYATNNIAFKTGSSKDLVVQNSGGTITSANGSVNFRDTAYGGKGLTQIQGGSVSAAQAINFYGGDGDVEAQVDALIGIVNIYGGLSHVTANSDLLMGKILLSGDPSIVSTTGNVTLTSNQIFPGQALAILAKGNVLADPAVKKIDISSPIADGGRLTIVAGFDMTQTAGAVDLTGANTSGGSVLLPGVVIKTGSAKGNGGSVGIYAHSGLLSGGEVSIGSIDTSAPKGLSGSIIINAPANVTIGTKTTGTAINTSGGTSGSVSVVNFQPFWMTAPHFDAQGNFTSGDFDNPTAVATPGTTNIVGKITANSTSGNSGGITLRASSALTTGAITTIATGANKTGGSIQLGSLGPITVNGSLQTFNSKGSSAFMDLNAGGALLVKGDLDAHGLQGNQIITNSTLGATTVTGTVNTSASAPNGIGQSVTMTAGGVGGAIEVAKGINASGPGKAGAVTLTSALSNVNLGFNPLSVSVLPIASKPASIVTSSKNGQAGLISVTAGDNVWISGGISATSGLATTFQTTTLTAGDRVRVDGVVDASTAASGGRSGIVTMSANLLGTSSPFFGVETGPIKTDGSQGNVNLAANNGVVLVRGGISAKGLANGSFAGGVVIQTGGDLKVQGTIDQTSLGTGAMTVLTTGLNSSTGRVLVSGDLKGSAVVGTGTDYILSGQDGVTVGGGITTHGGAGAGVALLQSESGMVGVGKGIDASGADGANGTHGGNVSLRGAGVTVGGDIKTFGGNAKAAAGNGGLAGTILLSGIQSPINNLFDGYVTVKGLVSAHGGNSTNTNGQGAGGDVTINGGSMLVSGKDKAGVSIDSSGGQNLAGAYGTAGNIAITSDATQDIPNSFDFTSTKKTEYALPGSILDIGKAKVAGTAGSIKAGATVMSGTTLSNSSTFNGPITIKIRNNTAVISEGGQNKQIYAYSGNTFTSPRTLVTPGEAMALYAKTHTLGTVSVAADGTLVGTSVVINSFDFSHPISVYKVPVGVGIQVDMTSMHPTAFIDLAKSGNVVIRNPISTFGSDGQTAARQITIANSNVKFATSGGFFDGAGALGGTTLSFIGGKSLKIENNGIIQTSRVFAQAGGGGINLTMGNGGTLANTDATVGKLQLYSGNGGTHYAGTINVQNATRTSTSNINGLAISMFGGSVAFGQKGPGNSDYFGPVVTPSFANPNFGRFQTVESAGKLTLAVPVNLAVGSFGFLASGGDMLLLSPSTSTTSAQLLAGGNLNILGGAAEFDAGTFMSAGKDMNVGMLSGISQGAAATFVSKGNMTFSALDAPIQLDFLNTFVVAKDLHFVTNAQGFAAAGALVNGNGFVGGNLTAGSYAPLKYLNHGTVTVDGTWNVAKDMTIDGWTTSSNSVGMSGNFTIGGKLAVLAESTATNDELIIGRTQTTLIRADGGITLMNRNGQIEIGKGLTSVGMRSDRNVSLLATGPTGNITMLANSTIVAGSLGVRPATGAILTPANVGTAGGVSIDAGGAFAMGTGGFISSVGGDAKIVARGGDANLGKGALYRATGGNVSILSANNVVGGMFDNTANFGNSFNATSLLTGTKLTGGGVEVQSGTTSSSVAALVANRTTPFNFSNGGKDVMVPATAQAKGQVVVSPTVTLNNSGALAHAMMLPNTTAVVNPVVLIQANNGKSLTLDSVLVNSLTGVSHEESAAGSEYVLETNEDDDEVLDAATAQAPALR